MEIVLLCSYVLGHEMLRAPIGWGRKGSRVTSASWLRLQRGRDARLYTQLQSRRVCAAWAVAARSVACSSTHTILNTLYSIVLYLRAVEDCQCRVPSGRFWGPAVDTSLRRGVVLVVL